MTALPVPNRQNFAANIFTSFAVIAIIVSALTEPPPTWGQTFNVLYNFTSGSGGSYPIGTTMAAGGTIYGGGQGGCCGGIFALRRAGSGWVYSPLYTFTTTECHQSGGDGCGPGQVTIGPNGSLYAANGVGGMFGGDCGSTGCGTVVNLTVPPTACASVFCPWTLSLLYTFGDAGGTDGQLPSPSQNVTFDRNGNLYGTTLFGGIAGGGTVYRLTPSNGTWTETILYSFTGRDDGGVPYGGVTLDQTGNLYGTTSEGGSAGQGTVFELSPSGSGWTEKVLYSFQNGSDGSQPYGDVIFDSAGNIYGTAAQGGTGNGGTVFELTPSGSGWTFQLLYGLTGTGEIGPWAGPVMDAAGNLYGTTVGDGANHKGSIYKLTRSGQSWVYSDLHDFTGGSDGEQPYGSLNLDARGNLYGTAKYGGANQCSSGVGCGVIFEITAGDGGLYNAGVAYEIVP